MTTTTEARRALLAVLLDRVERGALLPAEAPLLRPLVAAEQADADRAADATEGADLAAAALLRTQERCQAVRDREGPGGMINASQVLGLLSPTWPDGNYAASPDGPSPTPDDTPTTTCCVCGGPNVIRQFVTPARLCGDCFLCRCGETPCVRTGVNDPTVSADAADDDAPEQQ